MANRLLFISAWYCYKALAAYPSSTDEPPLTDDILSIAPHRVYLISLQPNCTCFLLHWSSYHYGRMLSAMLLYGVRTFLYSNWNINKPNFLWKNAKVMFFIEFPYYSSFTTLVVKTSKSPSGNCILMNFSSLLTSNIQSLIIGTTTSFPSKSEIK